MEIGRYTRMLFGSDDSERRAMARAAAKAQQCEYAVAPCHTVQTVNGRRTEGQEVRISDFGAEPLGSNRLRRLVDHRAVIHRAQAVESARYIVGRSALMTRQGILVPGAAVSAEHVMDATELALLVRLGRVVDRHEPDGGEGGPQAA